MAAIAEAAGVSIETIYLSIGGKPSLVRYLVETALSGTDQPVPALEREGVKEIRAEPDAGRKLQLFARMVHLLLERLAPIWQVVLEAAPTDAVQGKAHSDVLRQRSRVSGAVSDGARQARVAKKPD